MKIGFVGTVGGVVSLVGLAKVVIEEVGWLSYGVISKY